MGAAVIALAGGIAFALALGAPVVALPVGALIALAPRVPMSLGGAAALLCAGAAIAAPAVGVESALAIGLVALAVQRARGGDARAVALLVGLLLVLAGLRDSGPAFACAWVPWIVGLPGALGAGRRPELALALALASATLFLGFPRLVPGRPVGGAHGLTGFTDDVELGALDALLDDPGRVLQARFSRPITEVPYFRGVALDRFDGRRWWSEAARRPEPDWLGLPDSVRVEIELEAHPEGVLFVPGTVDGLDAGGVRVERDSAGAYHLPGPARRVRYTAFVQAGSRLGAGRADPYVEGARSIELPPLSEDSLALIRARVPADGDASARMEALAGWLREGFTYTRRPRDPGAEAPLERFLLASREGHCEYFASALAVAGRVAGVPTRLVNGFAGGEPAGDGSLVVRRYHAHAWVEYFDGDRWITIDATPAFGAPSGPGAIQRARELVDRLWSRAVVDYDAETQLTPGRAVAARVAPDAGPAERDALALGALAAALALGLALGRGVERRWVARLDGARPSAVDPVTAELHRALAACARSGIAVEGPTDLARARLGGGADPALRPLLEELARASYAVRFGGAPPERDLARARRLREAVMERLLEGGR